MRFGIDVREVARRPAGKGYYVFELVNHLAKIDRENQYFLYSKEKFGWDLPANFEMKIVSGKSILWHRNLGKALAADKIDVFLASLSYLSGLFSPVPVVVTVADLAVFYAPVKSKRKSVVSERLTLNAVTKKAAKILAISETTKSELLRFKSNLKDKIVVTPLAVSDRFHRHGSDEVKKIISKYKLSPGYVLTVGTIEPRKNIKLLVKAYAKLEESLQQSHPLVIVGKKGWYFEEVFDLVKELNLSKKIVFLDYVSNEDLPFVYNGAGLFVYPSVYEGFGLPVLEAIKSGVPTIVSDAPVLVEVGGGAVDVVSPNDYAGLATAMERILTDTKLADQKRARGLQFVARYDWQKTAQQTLDVLTEVVKESKKV